MAPAVQIIGLAITAVSAVKQHEQGKKAAAAQQRAADEAREQQKTGAAAEEIRRRQQARQSLREQRIRRARILQAAEGSGVAGSAGAVGAVGALGTLTGAQLGAIGSQRRGSQAIEDSRGRQAGFQSKSLGHQQKASLWQGVGQIGSSLFQGAGGFPGMSDSLFPTQDPSSVQVTDLRP